MGGNEFWVEESEELKGREALTEDIVVDVLKQGGHRCLSICSCFGPSTSLALVLHPASGTPSVNQVEDPHYLQSKTTEAPELVVGPDPWRGYLIMNVQDH